MQPATADGARAQSATAEGATFSRRLGWVGLLSLAHAVNDAYAYVLQAQLPALIPALGLSVGLAGALVGLYQITSSAMQPFLGHAADRGSVRWPAYVGIAASGVSAGLLGLAPNWVALALLLVVGGLGTAAFHPVSAAMTGAAVPAATRGRWFGVYISAGTFGVSLGPLLLGILLERYGPSGTWPIMLPALVVALLVAAFGPTRPRPTGARPSLGQIMLRHRRLLSALIAIVALRAWGSTALVTFIPLLAQARGLGVGEGAGLLTVHLMAGAFGSLLGGLVSDRLGRDRTIVASLLLSVPFGVYVALVGDAGWGLLLAAALSGFFLNGSYVVLLLRGQESMPGSVGMVNGIMLGFSVGLGGLAVAPLAFASEWTGVPAAAALAACFAGAGALIVGLLPPIQRPAA